MNTTKSVKSALPKNLNGSLKFVVTYRAENETKSIQGIIDFTTGSKMALHLCEPHLIQFVGALRA